MRLSELVSKLTPTTYTELALILFVATFVAVLWVVTSRSNDAFFERAGRAPLEDDGVMPVRKEAQS